MQLCISQALITLADWTVGFGFLFLIFFLFSYLEVLELEGWKTLGLGELLVVLLF